MNKVNNKKHNYKLPFPFVDLQEERSNHKMNMKILRTVSLVQLVLMEHLRFLMVKIY
jgi:hypothetical protein